MNLKFKEKYKNIDSEVFINQNYLFNVNANDKILKYLTLLLKTYKIVKRY